jgi:hypothetical protein
MDISTRSGALQRYHEAIGDLRNNPGVYNQAQWCHKHSIGHGAPKAMIHLGHAKRVRGKLHLTRERITDQMVLSILSKKREFDYMLHKQHAPQTKLNNALFVQEAQPTIKPKVQKEVHQPAPPKQSAKARPSVGIIRSFLRWLY